MQEVSRKGDRYMARVRRRTGWCDQLPVLGRMGCDSLPKAAHLLPPPERLHVAMAATFIETYLASLIEMGESITTLPRKFRTALPRARRKIECPDAYPVVLESRRKNGNYSSVDATMRPAARTSAFSAARLAR